MSQLQQPHLRWTIRVDYPTLAAIDRLSFPFSPWDEEALRHELRPSNRVGMTVEFYERTIGYMLYDLSKHRIDLVRLAVHPEFRRIGVGTKLVDKLKGKLSPCRRRTFGVDVRETNLGAQFFFKQQGFRAYKVVRGFYDDTGEDAFLMEYKPYDPSR